MKKKVLFRCLLGAPIGVCISVCITIMISYIHNDGVYYAVVPELITDFGNEVNAVLAQTLCSLVYGAVFAGSSIIWEVERWSLLRQTVTHLFIVFLTTLPIAYFLRWMPHNAAGVAVYLGIFCGIYLAIWLWQFGAMKKNVREMNDKVGGTGK